MGATNPATTAGVTTPATTTFVTEPAVTTNAATDPAPTTPAPTEPATINPPVCFVESECEDPLNIGFTLTDNANDCLAYCLTVEGCEYWTYFTKDDFCGAYADCPREIDCHDCISGEETCKPDFCSLDGECTGHIVKHFDEHDIKKCQEECHKEKDCNYWTFDDPDEYCVLYADCDTENLIPCEGCTSGEKECHEYN
jgi:hypothetical protein